MRTKALLVVAITGTAAVVLVVAVRRHLELFHGRYEGGTDWLIDLEYRVQALEGVHQQDGCGPCGCGLVATTDGSDDAIQLCARLDDQQVLSWGPEGAGS